MKIYTKFHLTIWLTYNKYSFVNCTKKATYVASFEKVIRQFLLHIDQAILLEYFLSHHTVRSYNSFTFFSQEFLLLSLQHLLQIVPHLGFQKKFRLSFFKSLWFIIILYKIEIFLFPQHYTFAYQQTLSQHYISLL